MAGASSLVKELREKTGAGILDCQKALQETGDDIDKGDRLLEAERPRRRAEEIGPRNQPRVDPRLHPHGRQDRRADRGQL